MPANDLIDPSDLSSIQGQSLTLPARVTGSLNDAGPSKPYDPSTVRGASAPELPSPVSDPAVAAAALAKT